jgi:hypothetical protein
MASTGASRASPALDTRATRATVFGLDVRASRRVPFLEGGRGGSTGRALALSVAGRARVELDWPGPASVLCSRRDGDDSESFRIEADPRVGYLIWGRGRGSHLLSIDGRRLDCAPDRVPCATWERFLIGQVLPFASLVRGLEIFHASAVVVNDAAIAFAGPPGAGKTSVALSLADRGATFLADDVVALERRGRELLAHRGAPVAATDRHEAGRRRDARGPRREEVLMANARERVARVPASVEAARLGALFFLDRCPDGPGDPRFEPIADPRMLLGATFNSVFVTPRRLSGLLDVCALLARRRVERVLAGPSVDAPRLSAAIARRLGSCA